MNKVKVIFATGSNGEFSNPETGELPWGSKPLKGDSLHFQNYTRGKVLIMGRKTFESLPSRLEDRIHVVLSNDEDAPLLTQDGQEPDYSFSSGTLPEYIEELREMVDDLSVDFVVIGGYQLIREACKIADEISLTTVSLKDDTCVKMPIAEMRVEWRKLGFQEYAITTFNNIFFDQPILSVMVLKKFLTH